MKEQQPKSNPRRGRDWRVYAKRFFDRHRPPCWIDNAEMDETLTEIIPQFTGAEKGTGSRSWCVERLRNASVHSEMNTGHYFAYTIRFIGSRNGSGRWKVEPIEDAVMEGQVGEAIQRALAWGKRVEEYHLESLPHHRLSMFELKQVEAVLASTRLMLENCERVALLQLSQQRDLIKVLRESIDQLALPGPTDEDLPSDPSDERD